MNFVRRQLFEHRSVDRAAQELIAKALERNTTDNISVLICCLNQQFSAEGLSPTGGRESFDTHPAKLKKKRSNIAQQCTTH